MLKTILVVSFLLVTSCAGSLTKIPASEKKIHASSELPEQPQQQILDATRNWMEKYFTASAEPVAFEDRQEGIITGNGQIDYPCSWPECLTKGDWKVSFTMHIDAQDGLISTRFRNIQIFTPPSGSDSVYRSGMNVQVWSKRDMDAIRPKLLELNNKLVAFLLKSRN
ncbi:MAG: DUF4468 domain-containing protein [Desulfuromusa sp.]|jgi:hypothetical protein|nr:DUF4468 domain-containing protein [Desulfuromusa sp.]